MDDEDEVILPEGIEPFPEVEWKVLIDLRYMVVLHILAAIGWLLVARG